jgi:hypothetical protein
MLRVELGIFAILMDLLLYKKNNKLAELLWRNWIGDTAVQQLLLRHRRPSVDRSGRRKMCMDSS